MSKSLERRLTWATLLAAGAVLAVMSVVVYFGVRRVLVNQLDRSLLEEARLVSALVELDEEIGVDLENLRGDAETPGRERAFVELWDAAGGSIYRSPDFSGALAEARSDDEEPEYAWIAGESGRLRAVAFRFVPRSDPADDEEEDAPDAEPETESAADSAGTDDGEPEVDLVLARPADAIAAVLSSLLLLLAASGVALGLGAILVSRALVRGGLAPLHDFAARIAAIDDRSLASRVDVRDAPAEVVRVGERLNELLDSLEATFERERAFSADIAHELRSPLASLRATVEVALQRPRDVPGYIDALEEARQAALRLQGMVDRLLWLVRLDAGTVDIELQSVAIGPLLEESWRPLAAEAGARRLQLRWSVDGASSVRTDPMLAAVVLRNVLENAVAYADEGGHVAVDVARQGDRVVVAVANSGSRVRAEDVPALLRRFTRGDSARTPVGSRCGLGLALVDRIARTLGHPLEIRTRPGETFHLALTLPAGG